MAAGGQGNGNGKATAVADVATVQEDITFTASGNVLSNDVGNNISVTNAGTYVGAFGTLVLHVDGSYTYTLNNDSVAVQELGAGQVATDVFSYGIRNGNGNANGNGNNGNGAASATTLSINVTGTNDGAAISGTAAGAVQEDGTLTTGGKLTVSDVDTGENHFQAPASLAGSYGTFSFNAGTGAWGYALNNGAANVQALGNGVVVHDTLAVKSADGTASQTIDVSIAGSNDGAAISGTAAGAVQEDGTLTTGGKLTVSDVDTGENHFQTPASLAGSYGTFSFNAGTGVWGYALNNDAANVQALASGTMVHDTLAVKSADGTASQTIDVSIAGSNDGAAISGTAAGAVQEDGTLTTGGKLTVSDVDTGENHFQTPASLAGNYGTFSFNAATGVWGYALNNDAANVQALGNGVVVRDTLAVKSADGTASQAIDVSITGTNDAPVVSGVVTGTAIEDGATSSLNALAAASDVDDGAVLSVINVPSSLPTGVSFDLATHSFALDPGNAAYQHLAQGQSTTVTVGYGISDGLATTDASVRWTITGTNDAPVVSGTVIGSATEDGGTSFLAALANASDVDDGAQLSITDVPAVLPAGVGFAGNGFVLVPGMAAYQHLAAGEQTTVTVNYFVTDGAATTPASVSWTVTGVDDAPVVSAPVTGTAVEDGPIATLDALANASDVDDGAVLSVVSLPSSLPAGVNFDAATHSFTLDPSNVAYQHLAQDQSTTVTVNYGVGDGLEASDASITWTVVGTNDAPVVGAALMADVLQGAASSSLDALANASDVDDGAVLSVVDIPSTLLAGISYDALTHSFTLDPTNAAYSNLANGQQATVTVDYGVSDGMAVTPNTVTWTVIGNNHDPVITQSDSYSFAVLNAAADHGDYSGTSVAAINDAGQVTGSLIGGGMPGSSYLYENGAFSSVEIPGASSVYASDINSAGVITGSYSYGSGSVGFTYLHGNWTSVGVPTSYPSYVTPTAINDVGEVIGYQTESIPFFGLVQFGFAYANGVYTSITVPGVSSATPQSINHSGSIIGTYSSGLAHGFILSDGVYTTLDVSNGYNTSAIDINDAGVVTGSFQDNASGTVHSFTYSNGDYAILDVPGATATWASALNASGEVAGNYSDAAGTHGFTYFDGQYQRVDAPDAGSIGTFINDVNASGQVLGAYWDSFNVLHGFIATPSTPFQGMVTEGADNSSDETHDVVHRATATIYFSDADLNDIHVVSTAFKSTDYSHQLGHFSAAIAADTTGSGDGGAVVWTFEADESALNPLATHQTVHETYTLTIDDQHGGTVNRDVTITMLGTNDAPLASDDNLTGPVGASTLTDEDHAAVIQPSLLLANDTDPEGDGLALASVSTISSLGAHVSLALGGAITYDPRGALDWMAQGQTLTDHFAYTISDGHGGFSSATASLNVLGVNDAPVAVNDSASTDEDHSISVNVLGNDHDIDGAFVFNDLNGTSSTTGTSAYGASLSFANGQIVYDPTQAAALQAMNAGEAVDDTFSYSIKDAYGAMSTATATVHVTGVDDQTAHTVSFSGGKQGAFSDLHHFTATQFYPGQFTDEFGTSYNGVTYDYDAYTRYEENGIVVTNNNNGIIIDHNNDTGAGDSAFIYADAKYVSKDGGPVTTYDDTYHFQRADGGTFHLTDLLTIKPEPLFGDDFLVNSDNRAESVSLTTTAPGFRQPYTVTTPAGEFDHTHGVDLVAGGTGNTVIDNLNFWF